MRRICMADLKHLRSSYQQSFLLMISSAKWKCRRLCWLWKPAAALLGGMVMGLKSLVIV